MVEEPLERANYKELINNPEITPENYWKCVEGINNSRWRDIGAIALFDNKPPKDVNKRFQRTEKVLQNNGAVLRAGLPRKLPELGKSDARKQAYESYFKLGVLAHPLPNGEYTSTLIPAFENQREHSFDPEKAAHFLVNNDHEKAMDENNIGDQYGMTHRNILSAMLDNAGAYYLNPEAKHSDTTSGKAILSASKSLVEVTTVDDLEKNPLATSMLLRRSHSQKFFELYRKASNLDKPHLIDREYREALTDNIDTFLLWKEQQKDQSGIGFEWVAEIAFREHILFEEMYNSIYVYTPSPAEDFPLHDMHGGPLDNKQSIDLTIVADDLPHFVQCKINGSGGLKPQSKNKQTIPGYSRGSGWYASPIKLLQATDMFDGHRSRSETRDEFIMGEFEDYVKAIRNRINDPFNTPQTSKHKALLASTISN